MVHNPSRPSIIVLSSPSGGGKTTQRRLLMKDHPEREFLISYTTRLPRFDEADGVDYHFLILPHLNKGMDVQAAKAAANADFQRLVDQGNVIFEHTSLYGNRYGTPRKQLEEGLAAGKQLMADVNLDGLNAFRRAYPGKVRGIFLMPPSLEVIGQRLNNRINEEKPQTDAACAAIEADIAQRLGQAPAIMREGRFYDDVVYQNHCSIEQTAAKVQQALALPATNVDSTARHYFGRCKMSGKGTLNHPM